MKIFLETERLVLRPFTAADAGRLFELDSDPEVTRFTSQAGQLPDYTVIQTRILPKFLTYYEKYEGYGVWAALEKSTQEFIGWFFLDPPWRHLISVRV
jgi:RimJ/RimL family protein N-acetyltransferase